MHCSLLTPQMEQRGCCWLYHDGSDQMLPQATAPISQTYGFCHMLLPAYPCSAELSAVGMLMLSAQAAWAHSAPLSLHARAQVHLTVIDV